MVVLPIQFTIRFSSNFPSMFIFKQLLVIIIFSILIITCNSDKSINKINKNDKSNEVSLSSGLKLRFTNTPAQTTLQQWAKDIDRSGGTVSHYDAVNREYEVVSMVNSGHWSSQAYHEYQRLAAGSGNVDSARLLMEYGIGYSVLEASTLRSRLGKLYQSISTCNIKEFRRILLEDENILELSLDDGTTPLIAASYSGCLPVVKYIIDEGVDDIDAVGVHGSNALMAASSNGYTDIIELLIVKGKANVNMKHKFAGTTALHMSSELNKTDSINILCKYGADSSAITSTGSTALHTAASVGASKEVVYALITNCSSNHSSLLNDDTTPLYLASQNGYAHTAEALLELGAEVSFAMPTTSYKGDYHVTSLGDNSQKFVDVINSEPGNGAEAIHAASEEGHSDVIKILVKYGADVNSLSMGAAPLHLAAQYNRVDVTKTLLSLNADINMLSYVDGSTPLYNAISHNHIDIIDILLSNNASTNVCQKRSGGCPLLFAVIKGNEDIVLKLLQYGADVNQISPLDGLNPLFASIKKGYKHISKLLLQYNPDICHRLSSNETVLHAAISSKQPIDNINQIINVWLKLKLNNQLPSSCIDLIDSTIIHNNGLYTALHLASEIGYSDAAILLIKSGSNIDKPVLSNMNSNMIISHTITLFCRSNNTDAIIKLFNYIDKKYITDKYEVIINNKSIYITPLLIAVDMRNYDLVKYLVTLPDSFIDINDGDNRGGIYRSPLLLSVARGYSDIAKYLLDNNANCQIIIASKDNNKYVYENLIDISRKKRDYDMLQLLSSYQSCHVDTNNH